MLLTIAFGIDTTITKDMQCWHGCGKQGHVQQLGGTFCLAGLSSRVFCSVSCRISSNSCVKPSTFHSRMNIVRQHVRHQTTGMQSKLGFGLATGYMCFLNLCSCQEAATRLQAGTILLAMQQVATISVACATRHDIHGSRDGSLPEKQRSRRHRRNHGRASLAAFPFLLSSQCCLASLTFKQKHRSCLTTEMFAGDFGFG